MKNSAGIQSLRLFSLQQLRERNSWPSESR